MKRLVMGGLVLGLVGCQDLLVNAPDPAALVLSSDTVHLAPDEIGQLTFVVRDDAGGLVYAPTASWHAQAPGVVEVDSLGGIRGIATGTGTIVALAAGVADTAIVLVRPDWRYIDATYGCRLDRDGRVTCQGTPAGGIIPGSVQVTGRAPGYYAPSECVLAAGGVIWCRGTDYYGELGDGLPVDTSLRTLTRDAFAPIAGPAGYSALAPSFGYTYCGLRGTEVWCWGSDDQGALGNDTILANVASPVLVAGGHSFTSFASEKNSGVTCGIAEGRVWCWGGSNAASRRVPSAITPDLGFVKASIGLDHSCALDGTGQAFCWGSNSFGELGRGTTGPADSAPQPVATALRFKDILANTSPFTCAVSLAGEVWCWGRASTGEAAVPGLSVALSPVRIPSPQRFASVHLGTYAGACALTTGGAEYCWGAVQVNLDTKPDDYLPRRTPSPY